PRRGILARLVVGSQQGCGDQTEYEELHYDFSRFLHLEGSQRQVLPKGVSVSTFFMPSTTAPAGLGSPALQARNPPPVGVPGPGATGAASGDPEAVPGLAPDPGAEA